MSLVVYLTGCLSALNLSVTRASLGNYVLTQSASDVFNHCPTLPILHLSISNLSTS